MVTRMGLEPSTSGSGGRGVNHQATAPLLIVVTCVSLERRKQAFSSPEPKSQKVSVKYGNGLSFAPCPSSSAILSALYISEAS